MGKMIKKWIKGALALFLTFTTITVGNVSIIEAVEEAESYLVNEYEAKDNSITIDWTNDNNIIDLPFLPFAEEFTLSVDVELIATDNDDQESVAVIFGKGSKGSITANIHNKIDWNTPIRVWGYASDEFNAGVSGTPQDFVDVSKKFTMTIDVKANDDNTYAFKYYLNNIGEDPVLVVNKTLNENYCGGTFGLMTYKSKANFSNIQLDYYEKDAETIYTTNDFVAETNTGDKFYLNTLPYAKEFTYTADVEFADMDYFNDDQQSIALMFGVKNKETSDESAIKANVHGKGGTYGRVWGYGAADLWSVEAARNIVDLSEKFRMSAKVEFDSSVEKYKLIYTISNLTNDGEIDLNRTYSTSANYLKESYLGGTFGIMAFNSKANVSNITLAKKVRGTSKTVKYAYFTSDSGTTTMYGKSGNAHTIMSDPYVKAVDFTYETDITLLNGPCVALTFGIENPENPGQAWCGANFNFNDNNARVFVEHGNGNVATGLSEVIQKDKPIHAKLTVSSTGHAKLILNNVNEEEEFSVETDLTGYEGGYLGLLTWNSSAKFENTKITLGDNYELFNSTDFITSENVTVSDNEVVLNETDGDVFAMLGMKSNTSDFMLEADVSFEGSNLYDLDSAGLVFGSTSPTAGGDTWYAANVDTSRVNSENKDLFRVFRVGEYSDLSTVAGKDGSKRNIDLTQPLHLKIDVKKSGYYTYTFGNINDQNTESFDGIIKNWNGGYVGLISHKAKATFSNIHFVNRNDSIPAIDTDGQWETNLEAVTNDVGSWTVNENGLTSYAKGIGDAFLLSESQGSNFVYSTTLKFNEDGGAAGLVFRSNNNLDNKELYAVNVSEENGKAVAKFWRWYRNEAYQLLNHKEKDAEGHDAFVDGKIIDKDANSTYELKVVAYDTWILYYVNGKLVGSLGDYNLQYDNLGQPTSIKSGKYGLINYNGNVTFQNTKYKEFTESFNPILSDITVTSSTGNVEAKALFTPEEPTMLQYVKNNASTVDITATPLHESTVVVKDTAGNVDEDGKNISVAEWKNIITVESTATAEDGTTATVTYHVNVHRLQEDEIYYNEPYRGQYHYSVKEGWANDPNGMIYDSVNGVYHLFYQFYDDTIWGPMHWAHATSTDLIHWEEHPIALYPDANGTQYSGCMVNDTDNTSGLFAGAGSTNFVALITEDGNGQRIKVATSTDGNSWTKRDEIVADWTDDPVNDAAFRDPKVFRWEGKWFMVVAGGRLRIYSSDDLLTWTCESYYDNKDGSSGFIETECPDLYPLIANDGTLKWVLSEGGRYYRVGNFTNATASGKWEFIEDKDYEGIQWNGRGVIPMNFGNDSYAAMTFYVQDFGTATNPTIPEIIEINWMNTWEGGFCNSVANTVGQKFNGTFNLNLSLGLVKQGDKYLLTQTPIKNTMNKEGVIKHKGYDEDVRGEKLLDTEGYVSVDGSNKVLKHLMDDTYEIVAKFKPGTDTTKIGFSLREGNNQKTVILYDIETKEISIDRSQSSSYYTAEEDPSKYYRNKMSQIVELNNDGSIDFHIYVDKSSVEVFMEGYTVAGAAQIFPNPTSLGASVIVEGGEAEVDLQVYDTKSIWTKADITTPNLMGTTSNNSNCVEVGDTVELHAYVLPIEVNQTLNWAITSGNDVVNIETINNKAVVKGLKEGKATITVTSAVDETLSKIFTIKVHANTFNRNDFTHSLGKAENFVVDENNVLTITDYPTPVEYSNSTLMSNDVVAKNFVLETDLAYTKGMVNVFFSSGSANPKESLAYAIQFDNGSDKVRLFRFHQDGDTLLEELPNNMPLNNGEFFHVTIEKNDMVVKVYVNDELCLTHEYTEVDDYFNNPAKVGIGVYDGVLKVKNFVVSTRDIEILPEADYTVDSYATYKELVDQISSADITSLASLMNKIETAKEALISVKALKEAVATAKALDTTNNTPSSVAGLTSAITTAEALYESGTEEAIASAIETIATAKEALVVKGDKTNLSALITEVSGYNKDNYTVDSMTALTNAITSANAVVADENADQDMVDAELTALTSAKEALVDISGLKVLVDRFASTDENVYTPNSYNALSAIVEEAASVLANKAATKEEVAAAKAKLEGGYASLVERANKREISTLIDEVEVLNSSNYTEKSYKALMSELEAAKLIESNHNATPTEVSAAVASLTAKKAALVDITALNEAISEVGSISTSKYTETSAKAFINAYNSACKARIEGTKEEVAKAIETLEAAVEALVEKGDVTALNALLDTLKNVDANDYTVNSMSTLTSAKEAAEAVVANADVTQAMVDDAIAELTNAKDALISVKVLKEAVATAKALDTTNNTPSSVAGLTSAIATAEALYDSGTEEAIASAIEAIATAKEALVVKGDKTNLSALITEVSDYNKDNYTVDSMTALTNAITSANAVVSDENADQDMVDAELTALTSAKEALVDISGLKAKVNSFNTNASAYTKVTYNAYKVSVDAGSVILAKADATKDDVKDAISAIVTAENALIYIGQLPDEIAKAETALTNGTFTINSKAEVEAAITNANDALVNATEDGKIETATQLLISSVANLVDVSTLVTSLEEMKEVDTSNSTPASTTAFEKAIEDAEKLLVNGTNETIADAIDAMNTAKEALVVKGNKTNLSALIEEVSGYNKDNYTEDSMDALTNAITSANAVVADENADQDMVDAELTALTSAKEALVDISGLKALVDRFASTDENAYTPNSYNALATMVEEAATVLANKAATKEDVATAKARLEGGYTTLVERADKSELSALITAIGKLNSSNYTETTYEALMNEVTTANTVVADHNATVEEVSAAITSLTAKQNALISVKALKEVIAEAKALDTTNNTPSSVAGLTSAITTAEVLYESGTEEAIASAIETIATAKEALVVKGDKTELSTLLETVSGYDGNDYTEDSMNALTSAKEAAEAVVANEDADQAMVNAALVTLTSAKEALVDISGLKALVDRFASTDENVYTPNSYNVLSAIVEEAVSVLENKAATKEEVAAAKAKLEDGYASLVERADKSEISTLIDEVEALNSGNYTEKSYKALVSELEAAKLVESNHNATPTEVSAAVASLTAKKAALVDITALNEAISEVGSISTSKYTETSAKAFINAYNSACKARIEGTKEEVAKAIETLEAAVEALVEKGDATELNKTLEEVETVDAKDYTEESVRAFEETVMKAEEVMADPDATQEMMDEALKAVEEAYEALVSVETLNKTVETAKDVDTSKYTEATLKALAEAIKAAEEAMKNGTAEEVEAAEKALAEAYKALEAFADYEIIDGQNAVWTSGSGKDLVFRADGAFAKFVRVEIDGKVVDPKHYTVKEGSTIVTFDDAYISTLSVGKHELSVIFTNGEASTTFTIKAAAGTNTGDVTNVSGFLAMLIASMAILLGKRKRA